MSPHRSPQPTRRDPLSYGQPMTLVITLIIAATAALIVAILLARRRPRTRRIDPECPHAECTGWIIDDMFNERIRCRCGCHRGGIA